MKIAAFHVRAEIPYTDSLQLRFCWNNNLVSHLSRISVTIGFNGLDVYSLDLKVM